MNNPPIPAIYCASKLHRAEYWRNLRAAEDSRYVIVSTWHDSLTVEQDDASSNVACQLGWLKNLQDLKNADALIAWCVPGEKPNGTLTEIGFMLSKHAPIYLVGDFEWGTWRHLPFVSRHVTVEAAIEQLVKDF